MSLPQTDTEHLTERKMDHTVTSEGGMICVEPHPSFRSGMHAPV